MTTEIIIKPEDQALLDAISNVSKYWHELGIKDLELYPNFSRKLVVTGFNTPPMVGNEERIYVNIAQILVRKDTGEVHKAIQMPIWMIHETNVEEVEKDGKKLEGITVYKNDAGEEIKRETFYLRAKSVQLVKFTLMGRIAYLPDVFNKFMSQYKEFFKKEIDEI